jgi:hypothetical protein
LFFDGVLYLWCKRRRWCQDASSYFDTEIVTVCEDCLRQTSLPRIKTTSGEEEQDALKHRQDNWRDRVKKQINEQSSKGQSFKIASSTGVSLRMLLKEK